MKAPQAIILAAILLGGVFGLTFLTQFTRKPVERVNPKEVDPRAEPLHVTEKVASWNVAGSDSPDSADAKTQFEYGEFEKGTTGHYDFWMTNRNPEPVAVRLQYQSCTCFDVKLGLVPAKELVAARSTAQSHQAVLAAALGVVGAPELAVLASLPDLANSVQWHTLTFEKGKTPTPINVPAADPATGSQLVVFRFTWQVQTAKPIRLEAELQHQFGGNQEATKFEVPLSIVQPLMVAPTVIPVGDLGYNDQRDAMLFVWSATRPSINVRVEKSSPDACIEVGNPTPLSEMDRKYLPDSLRRAGLVSTPSRMLSGYAIKVTVYERRENQQLDLGPWARKLTVKLDGSPDEDVSVVLTGAVRGAIQVGDAKDKDRIDLGTFKANRPHDKSIIVTSTDPNIGLEMVGKSPESLRVELKEQPASFGQKRWLLHLEVEPNSFSGFLPSDAAVILQTKGDLPRRIRIPITGIAAH